jgi:acyl-coenzyme A thioesterase PaaI-like protein
LQGACNDSIDGRYGVFTAVIETVATAGAFEAVKDRGQLAVGVTNVTDFLRPQREGRASRPSGLLPVR